VDNEMGGTERIRNLDAREDRSQGTVKRAEESEGDSESRHYIYNFSLCPHVSVDIFSTKFRINQRL
jgi:hypothetical protein